ncbi:hypothetical protein KAK07_13345 [Ideonella sp. 4Y16]|uniref:hypothetical protein n=1 Tax=Ideonella alba TaxID=2824118 RepID=UPI001B36F91E|nr:hypothetical protein [Ideonella alba]MBQ0944321.1 hypothetical protein [Ideonella alba]
MSGLSNIKRISLILTEIIFTLSIASFSNIANAEPEDHEAKADSAWILGEYGKFLFHSRKLEEQCKCFEGAYNVALGHMLNGQFKEAKIKISEIIRQAVISSDDLGILVKLDQEVDANVKYLAFLRKQYGYNASDGSLSSTIRDLRPDEAGYILTALRGQGAAIQIPSAKPLEVRRK